MKIKQKIEKVFPPLQADRKRVTRSRFGVVARDLACVAKRSVKAWTPWIIIISNWVWAFWKILSSSQLRYNINIFF